jgi:hypothetical protein
VACHRFQSASKLAHSKNFVLLIIKLFKIDMRFTLINLFMEAYMSDKELVTFYKPSGTVIGEAWIGSDETVNQVTNEIPVKLGLPHQDATGAPRNYNLYAHGEKLSGDLPFLSQIGTDRKPVISTDIPGAAELRRSNKRS